MKKGSKLAAFVIVLTLAAAVGTVFSYMFRRTEEKNNRFDTAKVSCGVQELTDENVTEKTSIKVKNTGNIDAYLRVRLVSYWVQTAEDGDPEIAGKPSITPAVEPGEGWIAGPSNTYYYQNPVSPNDLTNELLSSKITLREDDGYRQVIEVFAEAIQSKPASSVMESWNVTLDADGKIVSVS